MARTNYNTMPEGDSPTIWIRTELTTFFAFDGSIFPESGLDGIIQVGARIWTKIRLKRTK